MEPITRRFQHTGNRTNLSATSGPSALGASPMTSSARAPPVSADPKSKPSGPSTAKFSPVPAGASPQMRDPDGLVSRPRTPRGPGKDGSNEHGQSDTPRQALGSPILAPPADSMSYGTMGKGAFRTRPGLERRPSPRREVLPANIEEESESSSSEEERKSSTKGSVIGKVAQRAKLVLPLRRVHKDQATGKKTPTSRSSSSVPTAQPVANSNVADESDSSTESSEESESEDDDPAEEPVKKKPIPEISESSNFTTFEPSKPRPIVPPETLMRDDNEVNERDVTQGSDIVSSSRPGTAEALPIQSKTPPSMSQTALLPSTSENDTLKSNPTKTIAERRGAQDASSSQVSQGRSISKPSSLDNMSTLKPNYGNKSSADLPLSPIPEASVLKAETHRPASPNPATSENSSSKPDAQNQEGDENKGEASAPPFNLPKSTSAFNLKPDPPATPPQPAYEPRPKRHPPTQLPELYNSEKGPKVDPAPAGAMYWSRARSLGYDRLPVRAHAMSIVGNNIYVFGGCDSKACFNELAILDADCMYWSTPPCFGTIPPPLRAMTMNAVGKKIVIFGGGDGPSYFNDVYVLDTVNLRYKKPKINGAQPSRRRAHTACVYKGGLYVFGGGDGVRALNDVWRLDVTDLNRPSWKLISAGSSSRATTTTTSTKGKDGQPTMTTTTTTSTSSNAAASTSSSSSQSRPTARGYHTANMVGSKLIVFGGSDGVDCFRDVWIFDVETLIWKCVNIEVSFPRLSHSATVVGSYLFVFGGHDGVEYSNDLLLLNLVTMQWDKRKVYGAAPCPRGYHAAVLYDSRLFVVGGYDGRVFDDTFLLDLGISAYYSQISHFTIDV